MAFVVDKITEDSFYENMLLGLTKLLSKQAKATDFTLTRNPGVLQLEIENWERTNGLKLPADLKAFYIACNGIKLSWSFVLTDYDVLPLGCIHINSLSELTVVSDIKLEMLPEMQDTKTVNSVYVSRDSKGIQLTPIDDKSQVVLIYTPIRMRPVICLLDQGNNYYFLAKTFKKYFLMNIAHMGLPHWQHCFTKKGLPSWAEQLYIMMSPHIRVAFPVPCDAYEPPAEKKNIPLNKIDATIFKNKRLGRNHRDIDMILKM